MRKSTIYWLIDPRETEPKKRYRYIGKTVCKLCDRLSGHILDAKRRNSNTHVANWIRKLLNDSVRPFIMPIEVVNENRDCERESYWIKHFRDNGFNLCNLTDGGEGRKNIVVSEETKQKLREAMKYRTGEKAPNYGHHHSEEFKEKMRNRMLGNKNPIYGKGDDRSGKKNWFYGKKHSDETKKKMSLCNRGSNNPNYGKKISEEQKAKIRATWERKKREQNASF